MKPIKINVALSHDDDSQNCYVYRSMTGPGDILVKVWIPRRLLDRQVPTAVEATVKISP